MRNSLTASWARAIQTAIWADQVGPDRLPAEGPLSGPSAMPSVVELPSVARDGKAGSLFHDRAPYDCPMGTPGSPH